MNLTAGGLQVCKKELQEMSIASAQQMARSLVHREQRGPGDLENAMRRLETKYGIPFGALWSLRYRPPRDILASVYLKIQAAYQAECERQARLLAHEAAIIGAKQNEANADLIAEVEALLAKLKEAA
jgi:hypothetical protein